jgi:ribosomal-protein-alanine N-acetyltransferase
VTRRLLLRRAVPADGPELEALERASFTHPWTAAQIEEEVAAGAPGEVLVLEAPPGAGGGGRLRAYCAFRLVLDEMHVLNVAVAPPERRRGLARWLLRFAMSRAARGGASRALLEVRAGNREAVALYESLGFRQLGLRREYYREPIEDALVLLREGLAAKGAKGQES